MLDLNGFKEKVGVSKNSYVQDWLDHNLIPGVVRGETLKDTQFPESARRPYRSRWLTAKSDATKIRAHIVKACIDKMHICKDTCFISGGEFDGYINQLVDAGMIVIRNEDGIRYFDSTPKSDEYKGKELKEVREFVIKALSAISEGAAKGAMTAFFETHLVS